MKGRETVKPVEKIGILGGGQLARMIAQSALKMGKGVKVLAPSMDAPAVIPGVEVVIGPMNDLGGMLELMAGVDCVTIENEFLDLPRVFLALDKFPGVSFCPDPLSVGIAQDKLEQKRLWDRAGIATAPWMVVPEGSHSDALRNLARRFPDGYVLKWSRLGYDGRGNFVVRNPFAAPSDEIRAFCDAGRKSGAAIYAEQLIDFTHEVAMVSARGSSGEQVFYPLVVSVQEKGVCREVTGPATMLGMTVWLEERAKQVLRWIGEELAMCGTFAVEFFVTGDGRLLVNELAPRVHNTGHYSLFAGELSQFDSHVEAITGMPLTEPSKGGLVAMRNLLGPFELDGELVCPHPGENPDPGIALHWYNKTTVSAGRKMGHLTGRASNPQELSGLLERMRAYEQTLWASTIGWEK